jgi:hypothetical protein
MKLLHTALAWARPARFAAWAALLVAGFSLWPGTAGAIPLFNRQTGQNCMACHAGGQFPELTPYGRLFKMTGYTIGERTMPISAMALGSVSKVANTSKSADPAADFQKEGKPIFATASVFLGGKIADNLGAFAQFTYDPYASQTDSGHFKGHAGADNIDIRYADRLVDENQDLIFGLSVNNNPSISDPWNTAAAWMQYVPVPSPTSSQFIDGAAPYPGFASGGNLAGLSAYTYWHQSVYAELGAYRTGNGVFKIMSAGSANADVTKLSGLNPYWRLAYNHEWGANSLMVGTSGMVARIFDDPLNTSDTSSLHHYRDIGLDSQYQYILDPHTVTAQLAYLKTHHRSPAMPPGAALSFTDPLAQAQDAMGSTDTSNVLRSKLTYIYQAKYGGSLGVFNLTGSATPVTRGMTWEAFWTPVQYLRFGAQYTAYARFDGAATNYDGAGRNAHDNNSLFIYLWGAY